MVRSLPLPPTHSAPVFRQRAIVAFWAGELETAAESSRRRRRRRRRRTTIGREGEGEERGRPKIFADASENGSSPPPLLPNPKWAGGADSLTLSLKSISSLAGCLLDRLDAEPILS